MKYLPEFSDVTINVAPLGVYMEIHVPREGNWAVRKTLLLFQGGTNLRTTGCETRATLYDPPTKKVLEDMSDVRRLKTIKGQIDFLMDSFQEMYVSKIGE